MWEESPPPEEGPETLPHSGCVHRFVVPPTASALAGGTHHRGVQQGTVHFRLVTDDECTNVYVRSAVAGILLGIVDEPRIGRGPVETHEKLEARNAVGNAHRIWKGLAFRKRWPIERGFAWETIFSGLRLEEQKT